MSVLKKVVRKRTPELTRLLTELDQTGSETSSGKTGPRKGLILTNEAKLRCENPSFGMVELVVAELAVVGNRYCHLTDESNSYVQTYCTPAGNWLERRLYSGDGNRDYAHLRAYYPGAESDLIATEDVLAAFRSFYAGGDGNAWFEWRPLAL